MKPPHFSWALTAGSSVHVVLAEQHPASWHGDGYWGQTPVVVCGSTAIASCGKHLAFLQLHHGKRRVTVDEAVALLGERACGGPQHA